MKKRYFSSILITILVGILFLLGLKFSEEITEMKAGMKNFYYDRIRLQNSNLIHDIHIKKGDFFKGGGTNVLIAHAGGRIYTHDYTNSFEAVDKAEKNYDYLEVDVRVTTDGVPVLVHEWKKDKLSLNEFLDSGKEDGFTYITLEEACDFAIHEKIKLILDPRFDSEQEVDCFIDVLREFDQSVKLREYVAVIINDASVYKQAYQKIDVEWLDRLDVNESYYEEMLFCETNNISCIVVDPLYLDVTDLSIFQDCGVDILIYKLDDAKECVEYFDAGCTGVFTNIVISNDIEYWDKKI